MITEEELQEEDEAELSKIIGQFNLTLNRLMQPLRLYGQGHYVDMVMLEIISNAWIMHWKLLGLEVPYELKNIHW